MFFFFNISLPDNIYNVYTKLYEEVKNGKNIYIQSDKKHVLSQFMTAYA